MAVYEAHGFTTREEWGQFFSDYFITLQGINELANSAKRSSSDEWFKEFEEKSRLLADLYKQNREGRNQHIAYFVNNSDHWTAETASSLLSYLFRHCTLFEDIEASFMLTSSLYRYFSKTNDEIALMKCCTIFAVCYLYLDIIHFRSRVLAVCNLGERLFLKHYDELDEEEKSLAITLYDVKSVVYGQIIQITMPIKQYFDTVLVTQFEKSQQVIDRFMKEENMELPINAVIPVMKQAWINEFTSIIKFIDMSQLRFDQLMYIQNYLKAELESSKQHNLPAARIVICSSLVLIIDWNLHQLDSTYVMKMLKGYEAMLPIMKMDTFEAYDDEIFNAYQTLAFIYGIVAEVHAEYSTDVEHILWILHDFIVSFANNNYLEQVADSTIYFCIVPLLKYLSEEKALHMLLSLTVFRQPQTAIHTVMVSKCVIYILERLIDDHPELFTDKDNITLEAVIKHKADIKEYGIKAALLHDVGKVLCTNVINVQYRKLMDLEFETIKFHPLTSKEILLQIPALMCYTDVAVGHHKSYDDTYGYPKNFNTKKSPYKIFIDLISICDSLDAATDNLGRSYAKTKTFAEVMLELTAAKGTRYSSDIVDWINNSPEVYAQLQELLESKRESTYREVFEVLVKNKDDSGENTVAGKQLRDRFIISCV